MLEIRKAEQQDWQQIWPIMREVIAGGDTYPYDPDMNETQARATWMDSGGEVYVAVQDGVVVGTYYLKPNKEGLGAHVCNAGYMVAAASRGKGIGRALCEHSLRRAAEAGFRAMQFNLVVSTNSASLRLWKKMGFEIVGTLPEAFRHRTAGFVDAYVMYRFLDR